MPLALLDTGGTSLAPDKRADIALELVIIVVDVHAANVNTAKTTPPHKALRILIIMVTLSLGGKSTASPTMHALICTDCSLAHINQRSSSPGKLVCLCAPLHRQAYYGTTRSVLTSWIGRASQTSTPADFRNVIFLTLRVFRLLRRADFQALNQE